MSAEILAFETPDAEGRNEGEQALIVDVEGFEGPLDLLLMLARQQKVDLAKISILALAHQYLRFVEQARQKRLELAADYLVMAAWLAYLKSRLLLPVAASADGPSAEDLASSLALRLKRLEVFRAAATQMMERPQLGREIFARGAPEPIRDVKKAEYSGSLYDLLSAYAVQRQKHALNRVRFEPRKVWSLVEARNALDRFIGGALDWSRLDRFLLDYGIDPKSRATALASSFAVALEMVREGQLEMQQKAALSPLYLRKRIASDEPGSAPN